MQHGRVRPSGVGNIRIRGNARTEGTQKAAEVMHKQGRWYVSVTVVCEPKRARMGNGAAGLDWGVETFATVANEDGSTLRTENHRHLGQARAQLRSAQRQPARKKRGSRNRDKARREVAALHRKVGNRRHDFLHQQRAALVATLAVLATEKLQVANMTRSAKGTVDDPGKNARQKAGLNRNILYTAPAACRSKSAWTRSATKRRKTSGSILVTLLRSTGADASTFLKRWWRLSRAGCFDLWLWLPLEPPGFGHGEAQLLSLSLSLSLSLLVVRFSAPPLTRVGALHE
jgi:hypothetical protein